VLIVRERQQAIEEPSFSVLDEQPETKHAAVAFSPDGSLAAWSLDKSIKVTATVSPKSVRWSAQADQNVHALAFSPAGEMLVAGEDGAARVYATADGRRMTDFDLVMPNVAADTIAISGSSLLAVGTRWGDIVVGPLGDPLNAKRWSTLGFAHLPGVAPPPVISDRIPGGISAVSFSHSGAVLASGGYDNEVRVWAMPSGELVREFTDFRDYVNSVAFSPEDDFIAMASEERRIKIYPLVDGPSPYSAQTLGAARGIAFGPSGRWVAVNVVERDRNYIEFYAVARSLEEWRTTEQFPQRLKHPTPVTAFAVSPKEETVLTASQDGTVRIWRFVLSAKRP
jgi:WD40 repeat protein